MRFEILRAKRSLTMHQATENSEKPGQFVAQAHDKHSHVLVDELASAIAREYDVNFNPARPRLKPPGHHRSH